MKTGLREGLKRKARSEVRARTCSGKPDPEGHAQINDNGNDNINDNDNINININGNINGNDNINDNLNIKNK